MLQTRSGNFTNTISNRNIFLFPAKQTETQHSLYQQVHFTLYLDTKQWRAEVMVMPERLLYCMLPIKFKY